MDRKLSAILAADVVGYSAMMERLKDCERQGWTWLEALHRIASADAHPCTQRNRHPVAYGLWRNS
jgi:hypothetical protein